MLLCASRGVERKSICYLKTRGLRNNTEKHKRLRRLISGKKKRRARRRKGGREDWEKDFEWRDRARNDQGGW